VACLRLLWECTRTKFSFALRHLTRRVCLWCIQAKHLLNLGTFNPAEFENPQLYAHLIKLWFREMPVPVLHYTNEEQLILCKELPACLKIVNALSPQAGCVLARVRVRAWGRACLCACLCASGRVRVARALGSVAALPYRCLCLFRALLCTGRCSTGFWNS
jgi:hypothetical protein